MDVVDKKSHIVGSIYYDVREKCFCQFEARRLPGSTVTHGGHHLLSKFREYSLERRNQSRCEVPDISIRAVYLVPAHWEIQFSRELRKQRRLTHPRPGLNDD